MSGRTLQRNASHEARHHYSETEKQSYVDYINQIFSHDSDSSLSNVIQLPIDRTNNHLFDVIKEGVLLVKMINHAFPATVNEKTLVTKADKSVFEMRGNHVLGIQGCIDLGCSVVNIGPEDLTAGTPHLIMGLLWQVIKKSLLKQLNLAANPELSRLNDGEKLIDGMTPEQVLLQWMNYHLKRAGRTTPVKNFAGDIEDSTAYAYLMHQIDPEHVTREERDEILNEVDFEVRATKVIELARKVLGTETSIFVSPSDIVNGNPRLNLAFTATLYNSHSSLGPTEHELEQVESEKKKISEEKDHLEKQYAAMVSARQTAEQKLENSEYELVRLRNQFEFEKEEWQMQLDNEIENRQLLEKILETTKAQLEMKERELQRERDTNRDLLEEIERLKKRIAELENRVQELEAEVERLKRENAELVQSKQTERETLLREQQIAMDGLNAEKAELVQRFNREREEAQSSAAREAEERDRKAQLDQSNALAQQKSEHDSEIDKLKKAHELALEEMKAMYEKQMHDLKTIHETKIIELREMIQKLQDLLPNKTELEGFLVKQGGGRKNWLKRYFILKTNFMCYYKDHKNLKHPAGVIDLVDCKVSRLNADTIKKKYCFEIATPKRTYFMQADNDQEVDQWIRAIENAKAKFKTDVTTRQTLMNVNKEIKEAYVANKN